MLSLAGCPESDTVDPATPVGDLSAPEQEQLCDSFVASICATGEYEEFCTPCVMMSGCAAASSTRQVANKCALNDADQPITAGMVEDCGSSGELAVCREGGGCMFDALEAICD